MEARWRRRCDRNKKTIMTPKIKMMIRKLELPPVEALAASMCVHIAGHPSELMSHAAVSLAGARPGLSGCAAEVACHGLTAAV
jgi:hypothetical protein